MPALRLTWRRIAIAAVVLGLAGSGGALLQMKAGRATTEAAKLEAKPAAFEGVGALGRLEPGWKVYQIAPASSAEGARVESLRVEEGDEVRVGDVLAVLDSASRRSAALREAKAHAGVCRAKLALVKAGAKQQDIAAQEAGLAKLKATAANAEANWKRIAAVRETNSASPEEYEQRRTEWETARELVRQADHTLQALKWVRPEDVAVAEAELDKAEAGVARAEADLEAANIRSPIRGRVLKLFARAGEKIGESGLAELGDTDAMHAVAEIHERDVSKLRLGQRATVRVQTLAGVFRGEIVRIGWKVGRQIVFDNDPVKDTDARVIEVRIQLDPAASRSVARYSYARTEVRIETPAAPEGR